MFLEKREIDESPRHVWDTSKPTSWPQKLKESHLNMEVKHKKNKLLLLLRRGQSLFSQINTKKLKCRYKVFALVSHLVKK